MTKPEDLPTRVTPNEWSAITSQLEMHHALFYQMWIMGRPVLDPKMPTACVAFDPAGEFVSFAFNPQLWQKSTTYERKFIIGHECLHVILDHGLRALTSKDSAMANVAMDIVVNHSLINNFGFDRSQLSMDKDLCWVDTVFPGEQIQDNGTFEFYFNKLKESGKTFKQFDDHSQLGSFDKNAIQKVLDKLKDSLSEEEKEALNGLLAGSGSQGRIETVEVEKVPKKKKWETVIKEWSKQFKKDDVEIEQWARISRRYTFLPSDLIIPSEAEDDHFADDKIEVWFFQDCSGSCAHLKNRFFKAAKSLPPERFDVKMHTFDDVVYEVDLKGNQVRGFGGTSFSAIEEYIQKYIKENGKSYPRAVFCISDGYGDYVHPEYPENWYWFLTTIYSHCIPEESNIYQLADFE